MKEEKLMILSMLKDGRISVDEAYRLLEVVAEPKCKIKIKDKNFDGKISKAADNVGTFAKEVGEKFESKYKALEPKIKEVSQKIVEKTASAVDSVSKKLNSKLNEAQKDDSTDDLAYEAPIQEAPIQEAPIEGEETKSECEPETPPSEE
jgi:tRNA U34 5-carboxymethylaminomethyl modifying enzyme MnmG/GidA